MNTAHQNTRHTTATASTTTTNTSSSHFQDATHKLFQVLQVTGKRASLASQQAKLGADLLWLQQKIQHRQQTFGVDLYETLEIIVDRDPMMLLGDTSGAKDDGHGHNNSMEGTGDGEVPTKTPKKDTLEEVTVEPLEDAEEEVLAGTNNRTIADASPEKLEDRDEQNDSNNSPTTTGCHSWPLEHIQGLFVAAYKNHKALVQKEQQQDDKLTALAEQRRCVQSRHGGTLSFDVPADSVGERLLNAPKLARIRGEETRLQGNRASLRQQILHIKYDFGRQCYQHLWNLEHQHHATTSSSGANDRHPFPNEGWIPTHPDVRRHYLAARDDIDRLNMLKDEKVEDRDLLEEEKQNITVS